MTPEQFTYWLQGYAEMTTTPPTVEQWEMIREHLGLTFNKVTRPLDIRPGGGIHTGIHPTLETRTIC